MLDHGPVLSCDNVSRECSTCRRSGDAVKTALLFSAMKALELKKLQCSSAGGLERSVRGVFSSFLHLLLFSFLHTSTVSFVMISAALVTLASLVAPSVAFVTGIDPNHIPHTTEPGQSGYNVRWRPPYPEQRVTASKQDCSGPNHPDAMCQTLWLNDINDFCVFAPATPGPSGFALR